METVTEFLSVLLIRLLLTNKECIIEIRIENFRETVILYID